MDARWLELRGRDYPELGPLGSASLAEGGALAISRGAYRKPYAHVDPNEDGAFLQRTDSATLLCVVDGYNGVRASELCLDAVRAHADAILAAAPEAFVAAVTEVALEAGRALAGRWRERSRSCLFVAVVEPDECRWAGIGDCAVFRASQPDPVSRENKLVVGPRLAKQLPAPEQCDQWSGSFARAAGERIALVSDGVPNFVPEGRLVQEALRDAPDDRSAADAVVRLAMECGAGDNLAIATVAG